MKKISLAFIIGVICFGFINAVNAAESSLDSIATINAIIGGENEEIIQSGSGTYEYYYKVVPISDTEFQTYIDSKYIKDNTSDSSDEYVNAQTIVDQYETTFNAYIPEIATTADLSTWTKSTDKNITISDIKYETGKHHGYILGIAAVKDGDGTIYATRVILESKSATTLGVIEYNEADKAKYNATTTAVTVGEEKTTAKNPETGIEDYAVYLVPLSLVLGSGILIKRVYA